MSDTTNTNTGSAWIKFIISTIATIAMVIWLPAWFWLGLPFVLTYFVLAMRWL